MLVETKRNGQTITNAYDANNRLIFKDLSDNTYSGDISYGYDLRGLTLYACFGDDETTACETSGEGETHEFDDFGNVERRLSRMEGTTRELKYQYDLEGNRKRITHPDAYFFEYGFDGLNRMNSLRVSLAASPTSNTGSGLSIKYRSTGGRWDITRAGTGAAKTTINPDNALRLLSFHQDFAETAGQPTNDLKNTFTYNAANQVEVLEQSNTLYNYIAAENRTGVYEPNGLNQYDKVDGQTLEYDPTGNLTQDRASDGALTTYTYDMENHLVAVDGENDGTLRYDVLGRLAKLVTTVAGTSTTTLFHYDGDALVGEYRSGAVYRRYVHGDQVDEPLIEYQGTNLATRRYLHADHQGSIIAHSTTLGAVTQTNAYDPYGIPRPGNAGRFGYTGQAWIPELGLNYYKARVYSPKLGRFLQTDPIFYKDDMNLYAYVGNDPTNFVDPIGTQACAGLSDCIEATNYNPQKAGNQTVTQSSNVDAAAVADLPNYETTGLAENGVRFDEDPATGNVTTTQVPTTTTVNGKVIESTISKVGGATAIGHSHPTKDANGKGGSDPSPGPKDDVAVAKNGKPNNIVHGGNIIVVERVNGQFRVRVLKDNNLSKSDRKEMQRDVNNFQRKHQ